MTKVRALVPLEDEDGPIGIGEVFDARDEDAMALRLAGKVSFVADEEAQAKAAESGHYNDVTTREDAAPLDPGASAGGPQSDDEPPPKKGKK